MTVDVVNTNGEQQTEGAKSHSGTEANGASSAAPQIPEWLNGDLFVDLLKKNIPNFKSIKSFAVRPSQSAGENYATVLGLVNINVVLEDGQTKQVSYMIKLPIESVQKLLGNIFDTERTMYKDVIPEFEKMYGDAGVKVKFSPKYYDIKTPSEIGVVLMEDLRPRSFKNANRLVGFDLEHTKSALKKLAQWHAASAVRVETLGKYPEIVTVGIYTEEFFNTMEKMNETGQNDIAELFPKIAGVELPMENLEKNGEQFFKNFRDTMIVDPNEFNVLNHGDFWANNIMFQYDAFGKIRATYFVDFQCARYGSPAFDLYTLLLTSTNLDLKLKSFDYFVQYYHENLIECLKLLKYPKKLPTLKEIHITLLKHGAFGVSISFGHMAVVLFEPTEAADMSNLIGTSEFSKALRKNMYTNPRYRKHVDVVFPWLYFRGAFN